ncbi:MAG: SEC-C domain-containing protein [Clostridiales bacterium]|nr:SEC-C domain-containing protein [Clostridiales bacterium]
MKIYNEWTDKISKQDGQDFFGDYLEAEKVMYTTILAENMNKITGVISNIAEQFSIDVITFTGFLDGINSSIKEPLLLEELTEDSNITMEIDYEKLLYNMYVAKANWLYTLPEWDNILTVEKMQSVKKQYNVDHTAISQKVGRNDPCPCGSGKKYKKCCGK